MPMWDGRFKKELDSNVNDFNSSIKFDSRMYKQDILGSIAHSTMLEKQSIIGKEDKDKIITELNNILDEIESGKLKIDSSSEDIHMFVEAELTKRIGEARKEIAYCKE